MNIDGLLLVLSWLLCFTFGIAVGAYISDKVSAKYWKAEIVRIMKIHESSLIRAETDAYNRGALDYAKRESSHG